jgi:hypothetical protein
MKARRAMNNVTPMVRNWSHLFAQPALLVFDEFGVDDRVAGQAARSDC